MSYKERVQHKGPKITTKKTQKTEREKAKAWASILGQEPSK